MGVNRDKPDLWKADIAESVDLYNRWFLRFAPATHRKSRSGVTVDVQQAMLASNDLTKVTPNLLREHPSLFRTLRMSTCPPLAIERVAGLSGVSKTFVRNLENGTLTFRVVDDILLKNLRAVIQTFKRLLDRDIFVWLDENRLPTEAERYRAALVVADRLCGSIANPIVRNAQERRQLRKITKWLRNRGYQQTPKGTKHNEMDHGTYALRLNVPASQETGRHINIPIDVVIMPKRAKKDAIPLLVEAKSAGDFTNTNKRRKEEATKVGQLRATYGDDIQFVLFLCGYFDSGYLGYEAAEGIDWVWEHRIDDLAGFEL